MTGSFKKGWNEKKTVIFPDFCTMLCKQKWRQSSKFNKIWEGPSEVWYFVGHVCVEEQNFSAMGWPEGELKSKYHTSVVHLPEIFEVKDRISSR